MSEWISEAEIDKRRTPRQGQKLPDAQLNTPDGPHIVEFGGAYDKRKLTGFHRWCASEHLSYEVW
ncbi:MAG: hypothetical protein KDA93_06720 [Planctomycetaceae bacterium]|nr:hypothetical protein [Planctomycetaceae bacterium]